MSRACHELVWQCIHQNNFTIFGHCFFKECKKPRYGRLSGRDFQINKLTNELLSTYLVRLYNKIFLSGDYPESWSKGVIVPIYKNKGDIDSTNNYRGITLTNVLAKIFSHIL